MPTEAVKKRPSDLRVRLEQAAEESKSPVHPVYGWQDLRKTVVSIFKGSEKPQAAEDASPHPRDARK
jgi:hypothetical protein